MTSPAENHDRVPALDGIRGIAILTVLISHYTELPDYLQHQLSPAAKGLYDFLKTGWAGVDIFFVLSGFLITSILLRSCDAPRYYGRFYWRRALRILPIYYGTLAFTAIMLWVRPAHTASLQQGAAHQIWLWLFLANVAVTLSIPIGFPHFWSLAVEEHFYLFWPWIVRNARRNFAHVCLAVIAAAWLGRAIGLHFLPANALYFLTPFRMDALASGALLAVLVQQGKLPYLARWARIVAPAAAILFVVLHFRFGLSYAWGTCQALVGYSMIDLLAFCMIVLALAGGPGSLFRKFLEGRILRTFGKFSYAMYILHRFVHGPLYAVYSRLISPLEPYLHGHVLLIVLGFVVFGCAGCLFAGFCSWHLLEKHLLRFKDVFDVKHQPPAKVLAVSASG